MEINVNSNTAINLIGDGITDDTARLEQIDAAFPGYTLVFPPGSYVINSAKISNAVKLVGRGDVIIKGGFEAARDDLTIEGFTFENTIASPALFPTRGVYGEDCNGLTIQKCKFSLTRIQIESVFQDRVKNLTITGCTFTGDWNAYTGETNVVWLFGVDGLWLHQNTFEVDNAHRIGKITSKKNEGLDPNTATRHVFISENRFVCSTNRAKQLFDFYVGARDIVIRSNHISLIGDWSSVFEQKSKGASNVYNLAPMTNIIVTNNVAEGDFKYFCQFQGLYSSSEALPDLPQSVIDSLYQKITIANNDINCTLLDTKSPKAMIDVRGVNAVSIMGNNINYIAVTDDYIVSGVFVAASRNAAITGNVIGHGSIALWETDGTNIFYNNSVDYFSVSGNVVHNFTEQAGVYLVRGVNMNGAVSGNVLRSHTMSPVNGYLRLNLGTYDKIVVTGNIGEVANPTAGFQNIFGEIPATLVDIGNSWN